MTNDTNNRLFDRIADDSSRRNFLKTSALATAGTGLLATGTAAAQEDDDDDILNDQSFNVAMFQNDFRGGARFLITSGIIEYSPNIPQNLGGPLTGYNTHMASYLNTADRFTIFVNQEANLGASYDEEAGWFVDEEAAEEGYNQPALYELDNEYSFYEGTDQIITANAYPLEQDVEDNVFSQEEFNSEADVNEFLF